MLETRRVKETTSTSEASSHLLSNYDVRWSVLIWLSKIGFFLTAGRLNMYIELFYKNLALLFAGMPLCFWLS
jgi:hypothetical protein